MLNEMYKLSEQRLGKTQLCQLWSAKIDGAQGFPQDLANLARVAIFCQICWVNLLLTQQKSVQLITNIRTASMLWIR